MPAYNQGPFIEEAISSLKKQTFQDFELIIADDRSTDGVTPDILKSLSYEKISGIYFNYKNKGVARQTYRFSKFLRNKYFFILCADDKIAPTYIEECVDFLDNHPAYGAVGTWIKKFGNKNTSILRLKPELLDIPHMLIKNNYLGSSMIRRKALASIGYSERGEEFKKHYDYDRWVSMLEKGWSLGIIDKPLFYYRQLSTSLSKSIDIEDELKFRRAFIHKHRELFKKYGDTIALMNIEESLSKEGWIAELQRGRDWLHEQYVRLSAENHKLRNPPSSMTRLKQLILHHFQADWLT